MAEIIVRFFRQPKISTHLLCGALHPWTPRMSVMSVIIVVVMPMAPVQIVEQKNNHHVEKKGIMIHSHSVMLLLPVCLWVEIVEVNLVDFIREDWLVPGKYH